MPAQFPNLPLCLDHSLVQLGNPKILEILPACRESFPENFHIKYTKFGSVKLLE